MLKNVPSYLTLQPPLAFTERSRIKFINPYNISMSYGRFDSYFYSRPVSYRSYNPRVFRQDILTVNDTETNELLDFFRRNNVQVDSSGSLARGIRFGDLIVERRVFNHNSSAYYATTDYVIKQWKPTNDLATYHPTGSNVVAKSFPQLLNRLQKILDSQKTTI